MRFGNTLSTVRRGIVVMALLGVLVGIVGFLTGIKYHTIDRTWPVGVLLAFVPTIAFFLACLPALAFSIRIEEGRVKHLLLDRFILSDFPLAEFVSI